MSDLQPSQPDSSNNPRHQGPSLVLLYSLVAIALLAAIGIAIMIVLPFYNRR